ncbi:hypothetical protein BJ508DRAFT_414582 [Ascobolus immersus RN42]|uniref:Uncharacterized protein n=1 Tax=Ascobolus immersus RN42 TaxID=1160509 RepID=A0A3N4IB24_ASCIM|nr:hypothetical protein BJ508DRAFT_414582 [Ascobolus immersus RN42]
MANRNFSNDAVGSPSYFTAEGQGRENAKSKAQYMVTNGGLDQSGHSISHGQRKPWKPLTMRAPYLLFGTILCFGLIGAVEFAIRNIPNQMVDPSTLQPPRTSTPSFPSTSNEANSLLPRQIPTPAIIEVPDIITIDVVPTETILPSPDPTESVDIETPTTSPPIASSRPPEDYNEHRDTPTTTTVEPKPTVPPEDYNEHRDTSTTPPPIVGYVPIDDYHEHRTTVIRETVELTPDAAGRTVSTRITTDIQTARASRSFVSIPSGATPTSFVPVTVTARDGVAITTLAAVFEIAETDSLGIIATKTQTLLAQYAEPTGLSGATISSEDLKWLRTTLYPLAVPAIAITYLPVLVAVLLGIYLGYSYADVTRLEEFYQLSRPEGALVKDTIGLDYMVQWLYFIPFMATLKKQWAVLLVSTLFILVSVILPIVSSGLLMVQVHSKCLGLRGPDRDIFCNQQAVIHVTWARATQAVLGLSALLAVALLLLLFKRDTGLSSDPAPISGLCSLSWQKQIVDDMAAVPWTSNDSAFVSQLGFCRYRLGTFTEFSSKGTTGLKYGIHLHPSSPRPTPPYTVAPLIPNPLSDDSPRQIFIPDRPIMLYTSVQIFSFILHLGLLGIIVIYRFTPDKGNPLNTFLSSESPYVRLFFTLMATVLRTFWDPLDRDIRLLSPWKRLIKGNAKPNESITLTYTYSIPVYTPLRALWNRDFLVAATTFAAFVSEVITVVLANVAFSLSQTKKDESFAGYLSIAGLTVMSVILAGIVFGYRLTRKKHHAELGLPRLPYSTLGTMSYIVGGEEGERVLERYEGSEGREKIVRYEERVGGVRYGFGYVKDGGDRLVRLGVGEEPLLGMWS